MSIEDQGCVGRGEGIPYARYNDSVELALIHAQEMAGNFSHELFELKRANLSRSLENAIDCALTELHLKKHGTLPLGVSVPLRLPSATSIPIGQPLTKHARDLPIIKLKVDANNVESQLTNARDHFPHSQLWVDPNEGWSLEQYKKLIPTLHDLQVTLVEQPVPAAQFLEATGIHRNFALFADESLSRFDDFDRLGQADGVCIKLDKCGGFTKAHEWISEAKHRNLGTMLGCMVCSSLSIGPAFALGSLVDCVDLDGATFLQKDIDGAYPFSAGVVRSGSCWGKS